MKVKLYSHDGKLEARFSDNVSLAAKKNESKEDFIDRLNDVVTINKAPK